MTDAVCTVGAEGKDESRLSLLRPAPLRPSALSESNLGASGIHLVRELCVHDSEHFVQDLGSIPSNSIKAAPQWSLSHSHLSSCPAF